MTIAALRLEFAGAVIAIDVGARVSYRFEYLLPPLAEGHDGVVVVEDRDVPRPRGATLECRAEGLWFACICETPDEHWTFGLEAFGLRYDTVDEARRGGFGERLAVGYDLEWEIDVDDPVVPSLPAGIARGDVLVAHATFAVDECGRLAVHRR